MYELIQLSEHDYYIDSPAKVGLVKTSDTDVVAIDSGSDKDAGKKVLRAIEEHGWHLTAIYNTHSHADHIGGNRLLQERTNCRIYANGVEAAFTQYPLLEPTTLYGGYPFPALHHKFLLAQESDAAPLTDSVLPAGMKCIPLPGHSFDMVGFRTADNTVFLADCVSSEETLTKYGIGYLWNVGAHLETLGRIQTMTAARFVPSHAAVTDDIAPLARYNIAAVQKTAELILSLCHTPLRFEDILQRVFDAYGLTMTAQQYALIGSTVRSYLAWLAAQGRLEIAFENQAMLWHTV